MFAFSIASLPRRIIPGCAAFALAQVCLSAPVVEIVLRAAVQIDRRQVTLGDVAELHAGTDGSAAFPPSFWQALPLGAAPATATVTLSRAHIERRIKSRTGGKQAVLRWSGAEQVEISVSRQKVAGAQIAGTAARALRQWLDGRSDRSEISEIADTRDLLVAPGKLRLSARAPVDDMPRKRMQVWVDIWIDDEFARAVPVNFSVAAYRTAYVARQDLRAGRIAGNEAFDSREMDVAGSSAPVAVSGNTPAWRMKSGVARGGVLLQNQVEEPPAIARGETATLRTQTGVLTVEGKVEVLQDGYPGQMVKVRLPAASGPVMARVVRAGLLEMAEK